jgi:hypothetical protein
MQRDYDYDRDRYRYRDNDYDRDRNWNRDFDRGRGFDRDYDNDRWRWGRREYGWDWGREYPGGRFFDYDRYSTSAMPGYGRYGYGQPWRQGEYYEPRYDRYGESGRSYAGRGPRGYRRNDERIRDDVCDRLCASPVVDASDIDVRVSNGEVTLSGTVNSRDQKRTADDIAESVWGVEDVHNQLRVTRPNTGAAAGSSSSMTQSRPGGSMGNQTMWRSRLREGMRVVGSDQGDVGHVKEVHYDNFLIDRSMTRDVCAPFSAIRDVTGDRVVLNVPADKVDDQGWPSPAIVGSNSNQTS